LNKIDLIAEDDIFQKVEYTKNNFLAENRKILAISSKNKKI
jgi:hypothetical protein